MAGESITFDFVGRGADQLASDFKKTGDNAALAAKGARLCADALDKQRKAADVSSGATIALAKADKILADAEAELSGRAAEADLALRGEADAASKASREADKARASFAGLAGAGKVGLFAGLAGGAAALSVPLIAAGTAVAGFGALAAPTLDKVKNALTQTGAAGTKAWAQLDPAQRSIAKDLKALEGQFGQMAKAFEPVVASVVGGLAQLARAFLPSLAPLAKAGAEVITAIVTPLTGLVKSGLFTQFIGQLSQVAVAAGKLLGPLLVTALKTFIQLFDSLAPAGLQVLAAMQPLIAVLGTALSQILPPLGKAFANIVLAVLPLVPAVTAVAGGLAKVIAAVPPTVLTKVAEAFLVIVGAVKAWSIAQAALDALLAANPIGVVVVALAAIAAAFTLAWQKSSAFRDVIKSIGSALLEAGIIVVQADKLIVDSFLSMVGAVLHGAADAFGWVPGLGGKLRGASAAFDDFKNHVDNGFNTAIGSMQSWQRQLQQGPPTFAQVTSKIVADFARQQAAAGQVRGALDDYSTSIRKNGIAADQTTASRGRLVSDMVKAGVNAGTAQADVQRYTDAVGANGVRSDQARAARQRLISDIASAFTNSVKGQQEINVLSAAIRQHGASSDSARGARQRLIQDLVNSGVDSKTAAKLVSQLQTAIVKLQGKTVTVTVHAAGSGGMTFTQKVAASISSGGFSLKSLASGGRITTGTGPTADDVPALLSRGETVVSAPHSKKLASAFRAVGVPGYASGGIAGTVPWTAGAEYDFAKSAEAAMLRAEFAQLKAAVAAAAKAKAAAAAAAAVGALGGPNSASAAQAQAYARSRLGAYGWGVVQMNPLISLWNQESGWNRLARNPSSGAYGIPQALPASKMGAAANPPTSSAAAQINWGLGYIKGRYGSPAGAWGHEVGFNWYDKGGLLQPGLTLAVNNTGRPEQVIPAGASAGGGVHLHLTVNAPIGSQQQLEDWYVRTANKLAQHGRLTQAVKAANR